MSATPGPMTGAVDRVIRLFLPKRSALRRGSDRVEIGARWMVLLVGVLVIPLALTVGSEVTATRASQAALLRAERHPVTAGIVAAPTLGSQGGPGAADDDTWAPVRWVGADGSVRVFVVRVPASARQGDARELWVDHADQPAPAPPGRAVPFVEGIIVSLAVIMGDLLISLVLLAGLHRILELVRSRAWDAAWRRLTGPDTTSRR